MGSCFFGSFVPGVNAAPNGFSCSVAGFVAFLVVGAAAGNEPLDGEFGLDVNFELRLDIHEFRRPGGPETLGLVSLGLFGAD